MTSDELVDKMAAQSRFKEDIVDGDYSDRKVEPTEDEDSDRRSQIIQMLLTAQKKGASSH